jgi:UDP-glucuronate 4-epimerase
MRALVTGCAGFIGSHLTESLLGDGWTVVGVDCFNENYDRRQKLGNLEVPMEYDGFDFIPIDLSRNSVHDLVADCDVVFHLAAEPGVRSSWGGRFASYLRNNVAATQHLLEAAKAAPAKRLVFASSSSIYGDAERLPTPEEVAPRPFSPYGMTKLAAEHLCMLYYGNYGIDAVSLRYFSVYGPRQRPDMAFTKFCMKALAGEPINVYGDGHQTRDFTFVGDVVRATRLAGETPAIGGEVLNVGGGSQVSVRSAIELLEQYLGDTIEVVYEHRERGDVNHTCADGSRAREKLRFVPTVAIEEGLARQAEWARSAFEPSRMETMTA